MRHERTLTRHRRCGCRFITAPRADARRHRGAGGRVLAGRGGRARAADAAPFPPHPRWKFVFVNHVTSNPFFVPCQYGIQDACALLGCDYQWTGSETSDVAQMVNAMNAAIAGKADAIAVCLVDPKGFDRPVENALAAGIPVFSYNADSHDQQAPRLYRPGPVPVRPDDGRAHRQAGRLRQGRDLHRDAGPAQPAAARRRRDGFDQEIGRRYPGDDDRDRPGRQCRRCRRSMPITSATRT